MNFLENITFRRTRTRSEPNNDDSDIISQSLNCTTSNSMPDMSDDEDDQLSILKNQIGKLTAQLNSAHTEIELLSLENKNLRQVNEDLMKKNDIFKKINYSPAKQKKQTPKKSTNNSKKTKQTQTIENMRTNCTPSTHVTLKNKNEDIDLCLSSTSQEKILHTNQNISSLKRKICIISSETSSRIYKLAQGTQLCNFEICHYRKPNCNLNLLLDNIDEKVRNFTYCDYCIVYVGEVHFRKTHNYIELVSFIREKLIALKHTNFIICLPTFKYMVNNNIMYNSRIETFNNLLCLDAETYNYAYILDSNLNLPYTSDTYSHLYGTLNNKGLNIVISDLQDLVLNISAWNAAPLEVDCYQKNEISALPASQTSDDSQFFL